mmetsp:Transcript_4805/g.11125  ORF Transcript_4805/g.11125 Transcript_4805/m.11125 type:complete len:235 (-) Transcript_4805:359-1063(-)
MARLHPPPPQKLVAPALASNVVAVEVHIVPRIDHVVAGRLGVVAVNLEEDAFGPLVTVSARVTWAPCGAFVAFHPHRTLGPRGAHGSNVTPGALGPDKPGGARDTHVAVLALGAALARLAAVTLLPRVSDAPRGPNHSWRAALPLRSWRPGIPLRALPALRSRRARPALILHRHCVDHDRELLDQLSLCRRERAADLGEVLLAHRQLLGKHVIHRVPGASLGAALWLVVAPGAL